MALEPNPVTALQNATFAPKKAGPGTELSQVDFMKLIIAQMRNQNPLEPQKDSDFMAQMAQFESLNQMRAVAEGIKVMQGIQELTSAAGMLGKVITGKQVDGTGVVRDIVARELGGTSFSRLPSEMRARVNDDPRVQGALRDAQNAGAEVTGRVDRVSVGPDGIPMLLIGDRVVDLFTVAEVR